MTTSPPTHDTIETLRAVAADLEARGDRLAHTICVAVEAKLRRELLAAQLRRAGITPRR